MIGEIAIGIAFACVGLAAIAPALGEGVDTRIASSVALRRVGLRELVRRLRRDEDRAAALALDILHSTHAALRSGVPIAQSLRLALERVDPTAREPFERAVRAFELNTDLEAALRDARATASDRRVALALDALVLVAAERLPASRAAAVVGGVADRLAFEQRLREEVRARTSGVRAQIVLLALLVPAIALYLFATMPGLAATLATPLGSRVLVPLAAIFELAGILTSRRVVRSISL